jgi:hypothetical protein
MFQINNSKREVRRVLLRVLPILITSLEAFPYFSEIANKFTYCYKIKITIYTILMNETKPLLSEPEVPSTQLNILSA